MNYEQYMTDLIELIKVERTVEFTVSVINYKNYNLIHPIRQFSNY